MSHRKIPGEIKYCLCFNNWENLVNAELEEMLISVMKTVKDHLYSNENYYYAISLYEIAG